MFDAVSFFIIFLLGPVVFEVEPMFETVLDMAVVSLDSKLILGVGVLAVL